MLTSVCRSEHQPSAKGLASLCFLEEKTETSLLAVCLFSCFCFFPHKGGKEVSYVAPSSPGERESQHSRLFLLWLLFFKINRYTQGMALSSRKSSSPSHGDMGSPTVGGPRAGSSLSTPISVPAMRAGAPLSLQTRPSPRGGNGHSPT